MSWTLASGRLILVDQALCSRNYAAVSTLDRTEQHHGAQIELPCMLCAPQLTKTIQLGELDFGAVTLQREYCCVL